MKRDELFGEIGVGAQQIRPPHVGLGEYAVAPLHEVSDVQTGQELIEPRSLHEAVDGNGVQDLIGNSEHRHFVPVVQRELLYFVEDLAQVDVEDLALAMLRYPLDLDAVAIGVDAEPAGDLEEAPQSFALSQFVDGRSVDFAL